MDKDTKNQDYFGVLLRSINNKYKVFIKKGLYLNEENEKVSGASLHFSRNGSILLIGT